MEAFSPEESSISYLLPTQSSPHSGSRGAENPRTDQCIQAAWLTPKDNSIIGSAGQARASVNGEPTVPCDPENLVAK